MLKWQNQKCKFYDIIIILFWEKCRLDERYVDFKYVSSHAPFQFFMNVSLAPANRAEIMYICIHVWKLQIWKITIINSTQCIQRFAGGGGGVTKTWKMVHQLDGMHESRRFSNFGKWQRASRFPHRTVNWFNLFDLKILSQEKTILRYCIFSENNPFE